MECEKKDTIGSEFQSLQGLQNYWHPPCNMFSALNDKWLVRMGVQKKKNKKKTTTKNNKKKTHAQTSTTSM